MITSQCPGGTRLALWGFGAFLLLPSCSSRIAYSPRADQVQVLGLDLARTGLKATLLQSKQVGTCVWGGTSQHSAVTSVEFSGETAIVHAQPTVASTGIAGAPWYQPVPIRSLERVDISSDNWALVYISSDTCVLKVLFANPEECMRFADLMMSLHAESVARG